MGPPEAPTDSRTAYACMLEDTPAIWSAFVPWIASALGPGGIDTCDVVVHHAAPLRPDIAELCATLGLRTVAVSPFDPRSPRCDKLRQVQTDFEDAQRVVLMDVDMAFAAPIPIAQIRAPVAGTLVDAAGPPLHILQRVFRSAGVGMPATRTSAWRDAAGASDTLLGNFDGGLYIIDAGLLREALGPRWAHWTRWLLDRVGLLERWRAHVEQVAFCLALADVRIEADVLDAPTLLHQGRLDPDMRLEVGSAALEATLRVNAAIDQFQRQRFDNRTFWNHRYVTHPMLGSGPESRGESLANKRAWLSALVARAPQASLLDWGCGDLEVARGLPCEDGTGVDIAVEALRLARAKRPDWHFLTPMQFDAIDGRPRDLVLCLDVLAHQRTRADYVRLLHRVASLACLGMVVAGYDAEPSLSTPITYFHEPLRASLAALPVMLEAVPLGAYGEATLYFAATSEAGRALAHSVAAACAA